MNPEAERQQQQQEALVAAIGMLSGNHSFKLFMEELVRMKDDAVRGACDGMVVGNSNIMAAALGEVKAYQAIIDLHAEYQSGS